MEITSEVVMAIGMIALAVVFSLVSTQIISAQQSSLFSQTQQDMASEIIKNIEEVQNFKGSTKLTYTPPIDLYTITVNGGNLRLKIEGEDTTNLGFQSISVEGEKIEDADKICISKSDSLTISKGKCETFSTSSLCEDGCNPSVCQPKLGEDCSNAACTFEDNSPSSEATEYCKPDYNPDYIDNGDPTTEMGWVDQDYTETQSKGDRCTEDFECGSSGGKNLICNPATSSGPSGSYCCPSGKNWNGSTCKEVKNYQIVAVPIKYDLSTQMSAYKSDAQQFEEFWERESVFRTCNSPQTAVEVKTLSSACSNNVASACEDNSRRIDFCTDRCAQAIIQCASNAYPNFDKAEGLYNGPGESTSEGTVTGCAGKASLTVDDQGSPEGGAIHITGSGFESGKGSSHELGHDYGLCHGSSKSSWTNPSVKPCNPDKDAGCSDSGMAGPSKGTCIGCQSSYCPNDDPSNKADIMNYQNKNPPSEYEFLDQEDNHIASFPEVQEVLNSCR